MYRRIGLVLMALVAAGCDHSPTHSAITPRAEIFINGRIDMLVGYNVPLEPIVGGAVNGFASFTGVTTSVVDGATGQWYFRCTTPGTDTMYVHLTNGTHKYYDVHCYHDQGGGGAFARGGILAASSGNRRPRRRKLIRRGWHTLRDKQYFTE